MSGDGPDRGWEPVAAGAAVCGLLAVVAVVWSAGGESEETRGVGEFEGYDDGGLAVPVEEPETGSTGRDQAARDVGRRGVATRRGRPDRRRDSGSAGPEAPRPGTGRASSGEGSRADEDRAGDERAPRRTSPEVAAPDASHGSGTDVGSSPDVARNLGPRRWMAEVPDEERERLRREVERDVGPMYAVDPADRRRAVERLRDIGEACYAEHAGEEGLQMVVAFELVVDEGRAETRDPSVRDLVGPDPEGLRACLRGRIDEIRFEARRDGRMTVEHPLFFGERTP